MADKFGMMSQAYFKGKRELLGWICSFLEMDISKVEELASGAHYCQLLDALYPGSVKMSKVNFGAYLEETYVQNWKLIQVAFGKQNVKKLIPVEKLVKARFQDNLEFLQWFHQFFITSYRPTREYDPVGRRKRCKGVDKLKTSSGGNTKRPRGTVDIASNKENRFSNAWRDVNVKLKNEFGKLKERKMELESDLERISQTAKAIESERDFYFQVLLKVETICNNCTNMNDQDIMNIREVLYSTGNDVGVETKTKKDQSVDHNQEESLVVDVEIN